ncbi:MAG TPA: hypothetical protein VM734_32800 [Kofleriaceae bacterium]|nr:hypothetical protein [Kofleriaceae bacterium]
MSIVPRTLTRTGALALAAGALIACKDGYAEERPARARPAPGPLAPAATDALCATRGKLDGDRGRVHITEPVVRMVAPSSHADAAALRFTYQGPTKDSVALGSGQIRRQLGLKLRAEDGCNLVYVMWRIEPGPGIEVSVKRNRGKRSADDCGTSGYTKVKAARSVAVPAPAPGDAHTLEAHITGDQLVATVDGEVVWEGALPASARSLAGPAGLRTDNVVADVELLTADGPRRKRSSIPGCK